MNLLSNYLKLLSIEQEKYPVPKVYWIRMSKHYEITNPIGHNHGGAVYGHVFSELQPSEEQLPSDFSECIYIGKSGRGSYPDRKGGPNKNPTITSYLYKRTIHHRDRYAGTATVSSDEKRKYGLYEDKYGLGLDVMNGTDTGKPLWIGLIPIPLGMPDSKKENWLLTYERLELLKYRISFGESPLLNLDEDCSRKDLTSFSSTFSSVDITNFTKQ
tara:strand:- start:282 stop:926 length:645 start_codon:yes stop_codon:yes gene_type:complete